MAGIPHVTAIRTISLFGLSDVKLQFTYDFTYDEAQQWVINRLSQLSPCPAACSRRFRPKARSEKSTATGVVGPPGYSVTRSQDHPGLDPGAALQGGARRDRRHRLGRQDQDL